MLESGVPNLDRILGGGWPRAGMHLITGPTGSGKTTLAFQAACFAARASRKALCVSTLAEPPDRLVTHLRSYAFFDEQAIGDQLFLVNLYPAVRTDLARVSAALIAAVRERGATLLVIDGLSAVRDAHRDLFEFRVFLYELAAALAALECTSLFTTTGDLALEATAPELGMVDSVLELGLAHDGARVLRTLEPRKVRGQAPLLGRHAFVIDARGLTVYPRIESLVTSAGPTGLHTERLSTGLPELDAMTSGGLPKGSMTVLAGTAGTGRTLLALQYVLAGAARGQRGLFVSFRESPEQLVDKARAFGLDLAGPRTRGLVTVLHRVPAELLADAVVADMQEHVARVAPQRLAMDGVAELEYALAEARRQRGVMVCLSEFLRSHGVTAMFVREIAPFVGAELDLSESPLATLAENLVLLRHLELEGALFRVVSVLKLRDGPHDRSIRQYEITARGLRVLAPAESLKGVLAGFARQRAAATEDRR